LAIAWAPPVLYMLLIAFLSSRPGQVDFEYVPWNDKGAHFLEYAVLSVLVCRSLARTLREPSLLRVFLIASVLTAGWGYLDELHQAFVPGRHSDLRDVIADALGGLGGATLYAFVRLARDLRARRTG
jgi:VanZ family protein